MHFPKKKKKSTIDHVVKVVQFLFYINYSMGLSSLGIKIYLIFFAIFSKKKLYSYASVGNVMLHSLMSSSLIALSNIKVIIEIQLILTTTD